MKFFWSRFRTEARFLPLYLTAHVVVAVVIIVLFQHIEGISVGELTIDHLWLVILGFLVGIKLPTIMHNAAHDNLSSGNIIIGEFTAFITLISFGIVCINHTYHHAYPDSDNDPHSPIDKSFLHYMITCLHSGVSVIRNGFYRFHGENKKIKFYYDYSVVVHFLSIPLKIMAWYYMLGNSFFLLFYIPAFIAFIFTFAHVNYITHQVDENGEPIVLNMDGNVWYAFINGFADGIYYHKNHHKYPNLYNPKNIESSHATSLAKI